MLYDVGYISMHFFHWHILETQTHSCNYCQCLGL